MRSEPKWGHLKDLHAAIKLCEPALVAADAPQYKKLGSNQEVCYYFQMLVAYSSLFLSYNSSMLLDKFPNDLIGTLLCLSKVSLGYVAKCSLISIYRFGLCTELYAEDSGFLLVNNANSRHTFIMEMVRLEERCALHFSQTLMSINPHM